MTSRRHSSPSPLYIDDLLSEIILRLPPHPSSLPRASAVCKRWLSLVSDPRFLRRFRIHHRRNPPLLGFFLNQENGLAFVPTTEAIPPGRFSDSSLQLDQAGRFLSMGCRHGLVLIFDQARHHLIVWDPVTADHQRLALPPGFDPEASEVKGALLRAADGVNFQLVFVQVGSSHAPPNGRRAIARVYSSKTRQWGNLVSTPMLCELDGVTRILMAFGRRRVCMVPSLLIGDSVYWKLTGCSSTILEFCLEKQSLAVIPLPLDGCYDDLPVDVPLPDDVFYDDLMLIRADGGGLGLLFLSDFTAELCERKTDCDGVASWVFGRTIELDKLLSLNREEKERTSLRLIGFAEENNVVILWTSMGLLEVQLQSLQFKILSKVSFTSQYHPFESVYTAETGIGDGHDETDLLHNT